MPTNSAKTQDIASVTVSEIDKDTLAEANVRILDDDQLRNIGNLEDAFGALSEFGIVPERFEDYGTGFEQLDSDEKSRLVKTPFMILEWRFNKGDFGSDSEYVAALVVTKGGEKFIVIDGSSGIYKQLKSVTAQRIRAGIANPQQGLLVEKGLRRSDYEYVNEKNERLPATTYYLAN